MSLSGYLIRGLSKVLAVLPLPMIAWISGPIARIGWVFAKSRRRIALTNLRLCFPEKPEAEREAIVFEHMRCYVQAALEHPFLWEAPMDKIRRYIDVHDEHHWRGIMAQGRPLIWLCPHFVGLDAAGLRASFDQPACSLYSTQSNADLDAMIRQGRERFGTGILFSRADGIKPIIRTMKKGFPLFYLPDMDLGARDSVFVPFFGVNAATITGVSRLAKLTGAAVVPVIATQRPKGRGYDVHFHAPLEGYPSGDDTEDARRINELIESHVRKNIAQYLWTHKRFKTRPKGEASVYS